MQNQLTVCQQLAWEPNPTKNPVGRTPVKEGTNLPNSETEDVGGITLCPTYSTKQLRSIQRRRIRESEKIGISNLMVTLKSGGRLQW